MVREIPLTTTTEEITQLQHNLRCNLIYEM
jgi:hypothetical protein